MKLSAFNRMTAMAALALIIVIVAACSGTGGTSTSGTQQPAAESSGGQSATSGSESAAPAAPEPEPPFRYSTLAAAFAEIPDMNNEFWSRFQEENNVILDIQWIPTAEFITKLNLAIASNELPDVVSSGTGPNEIDVLNAIERGVFWDLGPFLGDLSEFPNLKRNVIESAWRFSKMKGTHYYIPRPRSSINIGYLIRKDLLDEAGVDVPETMDELFEALKAVKQRSATGKDMLGLGFYDSLSSAFGTFTLQYNSEGGIYRNILSDAYTEMVEWYRNVYAEGMMTPEFSTMTFVDNDDFFASGKYVFHFKNYWHQYRFEQELKKVKADAVVEIIPYISGPGGTSHALEPGYLGGLLIPKKVPEDRVRQILQTLEKLGSVENSQALLYGYEGLHHNLENGKYVMTELGLSQIQSFIMDPFASQRNEWDKVDSPLAPREVDLANREKVKIVYDRLRYNPWSIIYSPTWVAEFTKHNDEFISNRTKAIMGLITMDEYRQYIDTLRNNPTLKIAFKEMAESYKEKFLD